MYGVLLSLEGRRHARRIYLSLSQHTLAHLVCLCLSAYETGMSKKVTKSHFYPLTYRHTHITLLAMIRNACTGEKGHM